ncbi:hypothetical protein QJS10_CPB12g00608 [Acorus calamus]|uniref:Uncharacterized protein n=1 Tax=Acorus calamus TaxID=4465 RepID=A0AAV9DN21_ACOCL|nr:hypothetical protein QJS10_CPB12g00608 [Acorus calamus]
MDAVSIHVPYMHLKQSEVELAGLGADRDGITHVSRVSNGGSDVPLSSPSSPPLQTLPSPANTSSLKTLILSCMVSAGVQFGWALSLDALRSKRESLVAFKAIIYQVLKRGNVFSTKDLRDLFSLHANVRLFSSYNTMKNAFLTELATEEGDECVEGRRDHARFGGIGFKRVRQIDDGH